MVVRQRAGSDLSQRADPCGYGLNSGANQSRRFQLAYRGGRYHRLGRGFLGFGERSDLETEVGLYEVGIYYERDDFGNIVGTTAEDAFRHRRTSCTSYDAEGVFPYARKNPAGHLSFMKFDPGLGVQTAAVDPNGLVTRWAHDGLGRITRSANVRDL